MAKLLYTALSPQGARVEDFVEADSAASARERLVGQGLRDVVFHDEVMISQARTEPLGEADTQRLAAFKLRILRRPGLRTVWGEVARRNGWLIAGGGVLAGISLAMGEVQRGVLLLGVALLPFALSAWQYRHAHRYQRLVEACNVGQWALAERLIAALRSTRHGRGLLGFDLQVRQACIHARQGQPLDELLEGLDLQVEPAIKAQPALYHCRLASVYAAAEDRAGFVRAMRTAYEASAQDPARALDLALACARFGDWQEAERLLAALDATLLPAHGKGFWRWAQGMVALRAARPDALPSLTAAVTAFLQLGVDQPAVWTALAFATCDLAVALHLNGQTEAARRSLSEVWPVLRVHADKALMQMLKREGLVPQEAVSASR